MSLYHDEQLDGVQYSNAYWAASEGLDDYGYEYEEEDEEDDDSTST